MVSLWQIYIIFFQMGIFTFGGGYAMLPLLKSEVVEKKKWITQDELLNYYSIGQCTPGMIALNAASFIGYKLRRFSGLVAATMGVASPSIIIILMVAALLSKYMDNAYVQRAFSGIRLCVIALIINTVWDMWQSNIKRISDFLIFLIALLLLTFLKLSPVLIVLFAVASSLISAVNFRKKS